MGLVLRAKLRHSTWMQKKSPEKEDKRDKRKGQKEPGGQNGERGRRNTLTSSSCFCQCLPPAKPSLKPADESHWNVQPGRVKGRAVDAHLDKQVQDWSVTLKGSIYNK